jgi:enoyl-[acyl-carrier-protein] reductase (NADH)
LPTSHARTVFEGFASRAGATVETMRADRARQGALLRRSPKLAEVAEFAAFVASDRAGAMTGAIANLTCGSVVD